MLKEKKRDCRNVRLKERVWALGKRGWEKKKDENKGRKNDQDVGLE